MKYKIISMDFDGTLLTSDKKVTENTKNILKQYKDNGFIMVGVTARNLSSVKNVLDINMFDYIILNNGAFILNVRTNEIISFGVISKNDLNKIHGIFKNLPVQFEYASLNKYYMIDSKSSVGFRVSINSMEEIDEEIVRMNVYFESEEQLNYYKNVIQDTIKTVNVVSMKDTDNLNSKVWLSINEKNTTKLTALTKLANNLGIKLSEIIFFGDGENDLLLLENVGMGVAMGNAIEVVKEKSKAIALSNDEEGIYNYLINNIVIKR